MVDINYQALTDEEIIEISEALSKERARRDDIANLPAAIEALSARYYAACGLEEPPVDAAVAGVENAKAKHPSSPDSPE